MNCKQGQLAIIIRDPLPQCIGSIVEVVSSNIDFDRPAWNCHSVRPLPTVAKDDVSDVRLLRYFMCYDADLRPVTGLPLCDEVTDDELVTVLA